MSLSKALYFAAIEPPAGVKMEVKQIKLEIKEKFDAVHALKLPAHITLLPPLWLQNEQEEPFLRGIEKVCAEQSSFPVELKDFGRFGQRVIFINVVDHEPLVNLHKKLFEGLHDFFPADKHKNLHPHITLATRDLSRQSFGAAWQQFKNRSYRAKFEATALTLFKHNGKTWDVMLTFSF